MFDKVTDKNKLAPFLWATAYNQKIQIHINKLDKITYVIIKLQSVNCDTVLRFIFVYVLLHACVVLQHGEVDLVGLKPILRTTTSFSALTLSVGSFDL